MVRKQPEDRRRELLEIASRQFFQQGYEKTSIRSIVGEAGGEIGMFYHHFSSKDAIFAAVMEQFCNAYTADTARVLREMKSEPFPMILDEILSVFETSMQSLQTIATGAVNAQVMRALHEQTLRALSPALTELLATQISIGTLRPPVESAQLLVSFLLYGISAVIHDRSEPDWQRKKQAVRALCDRVLGLSK